MRAAAAARLAPPQVGLAEERLPVQVGGLDRVLVEQDEPADPARGQRQRGRTAQAARRRSTSALLSDRHPSMAIRGDLL